MLSEDSQKTNNQHRADYWFSQAQEVLARNGEVLYSPFFFKIFEQEQDSRYIAETLAHQLIQTYARHDKYCLEVGQFIQDERVPDISFKEMRIYAPS